MASQEQIQAASQFISAYNDHDLERLGSQLAPDCVYEEIATGRRAEGSEQIVELFQGWMQAMPDSKGTVTRAVGGDDSVGLEVRWEGTMTGTFGDFQPTGKRQVTPAALFFSFAGDQIREFRQYFDSAALYEQLGLAAQ
jgi:steroid delta-isomerase-like uncharacterized protein